MAFLCKLLGHKPREFTVNDRMAVAGLGYSLGEALNSASRICDRCHEVIGTKHDEEINIAMKRGVPTHSANAAAPAGKSNLAGNPFRPETPTPKADPATIFPKEEE